jgi:hypothetical protein
LVLHAETICEGRHEPCPEQDLTGDDRGGARLFGDGPVGSSWSLSGVTRTESGALCLVYDRVRAATGTRLARA